LILAAGVFGILITKKTVCNIKETFLFSIEKKLQLHILVQKFSEVSFLSFLNSRNKAKSLKVKEKQIKYPVNVSIFIV